MHTLEVYSSTGSRWHQVSRAESSAVSFDHRELLSEFRFPPERKKKRKNSYKKKSSQFLSSNLAIVTWKSTFSIRMCLEELFSWKFFVCCFSLNEQVILFRWNSKLNSVLRWNSIFISLKITFSVTEKFPQYQKENHIFLWIFFAAHILRTIIIGPSNNNEEKYFP